MKCFDLKEAPPNHAKDCVVAIGNFDGLHLGHRALLEKTMVIARDAMKPSAVLSFHPHPSTILRPHDKVSALFTPTAKLQKLADIGINYVFIQPFDVSFSKQTATTFMQLVLKEQLEVHAIIVGESFRFGYKRLGSVALLKSSGFTVHAQPAILEQGEVCSSSAIRRALKDGQLQKANQMLSEPYFIEGIVESGNQIGMTLGVKTANISSNPQLISPKRGVYAGWVQIESDKKDYPTIINFGKKPTFDYDGPPLWEMHLLGHDIPLYGKHLTVRLEHFIRPEESFDSSEILVTQIQKDIAIASTLLAPSTP